MQQWLPKPGPALLDVVSDRFELVMAPKVGVALAYGTALYSSSALLDGRAADVANLVKGALS